MGASQGGQASEGGRSTWSTAKLRRQEAVGRLRLRKASALEITEALAKEPGYRNPRTGEPWSYATILGDIRELDEWYESQARMQTVYYRGRQLTELEELRRSAWEKEDLWLVLKTLEREAKLTGTEAPASGQLNLDVTSAGRALPSVQDLVQVFLSVRQNEPLLLESLSQAETIDVEAR